jgi:cyclic pyranopterin phosphate synthase
MQIVHLAARFGFRKVRLTGGEPLLHPEIEKILQGIATLSGIEDVSLTTNGTLLRDRIQELKRGGVRRINISLDSLQEETYARITRGGSLSKVLDGIETALRAGLKPVKLNVVLLKGINEGEILQFLSFARDNPVHVRFIECMPFLPSAAELLIPTDIVKQRAREAGIPLVPIVPPKTKGLLDGPAELFRIPGGKGLVGLIHPMSHHFCSQCNRLRVTAEGSLRPCLLQDREVPLGSALLDPDKAYQLFQEALELKSPFHSMGIPLESTGGPLDSMGAPPDLKAPIEEPTKPGELPPVGRLPGTKIPLKKMYAIGG